MKIKKTDLEKLLKEEIDKVLVKESTNKFRNHQQIETWAGNAAAFLRQLSYELPGRSGRELNSISEKLLDAVTEAYEQGRDYERSDEDKGMPMPDVYSQAWDEK